MATDATTNSMNAASDRDPYNNNSYGTLVDDGYKSIKLPVLDVNDFNERIIRGYEDGIAEKGLPADLTVARSLVPSGTATLRDRHGAAGARSGRTPGRGSSRSAASGSPARGWPRR